MCVWCLAGADLVLVRLHTVGQSREREREWEGAVVFIGRLKRETGIMTWSHQRDAEGMFLGPTITFIYLF